MQKAVIFSILMVVAMIFWGSSWPAGKVLTQYTSADIITFWRFFFAFFASLPLIVFLKISLRIDTNALKFLFLAAICNALYSIIYFMGLRYGSAGKGGVLVTTLTPVFAYLLMYCFKRIRQEKAKIKKNEILGIILGIVSGFCLLNLGSLEELFGKFNIIFIFCAFDWALLTIICQRIRIHPLVINFYITLLSLIMYAPLFLFKGEEMVQIFSFSYEFWTMLFVVSVLSTAIGTSIYYMGIAAVGATKASTFPLLVPATALISSYVILGEIPSVLTLFGGSLAIFATYLINIYKPKNN